MSGFTGAIRYTNEVQRLYGVLNGQLEGRDFITGEYSLADMIAWPWIFARDGQGIMIDDFPHLKSWHERVGSRPAVKRALEAASQIRRGGLQGTPREAEEARKVLFGQRGRA
jgi:GSH-dependent disulfide-bond oxidoreductase